ncbi:MAG: 3-octaprenyl-4-hydroxybenzoate carboxy-lyase, partial [Pirellulaceae bacterium]
DRSDRRDQSVASFVDHFSPGDVINRFPWVIVVNDAEFVSRNTNNFVWVVFTRSNPAADIYGIGAETVDKHWGCSGSLVIDARIKPHHAPPLIEDEATVKRVDAMAARGGTLAKFL